MFPEFSPMLTASTCIIRNGQTLMIKEMIHIVCTFLGSINLSLFYSKRTNRKTNTQIESRLQAIFYITIFFKISFLHRHQRCDNLG